MQRLAASGKRLRRAGGRLYSAPTARPAMTATVSAVPWVRAMPIGSTVHAMTMTAACLAVRSPAAIGRYGLLTRSISTSVSWLTPTIATLTARPAISVARRSPAPVAWSPGGAIATGPMTEGGVRMIVGGRENPHSTLRGGTRGSAPPPALTPGGVSWGAPLSRRAVARPCPARSSPRASAPQHQHERDRHERQAGQRAGDEAGGKPERTHRRILGALGRERLARRRLGAADRERVWPALVAVPARRERYGAHVAEARAAEPALVLVGAGEQHPRFGEIAGDLVGRPHRADHGGDAALLGDAVGLGDPALRVRPILDRAGADVAVERVIAERQ